MSSIHLELLDKKRLSVFKSLKIFKGKGTLAGGTALSLQIKHRHSFDFDIFFEHEIKQKHLEKLKSTFDIKKVEFPISDQLTVITSEGINITLVHYYYRPLFKKIETPSLPLYSIKDIALDKAFTIGRRAVWRDYVDLFFILKEKHTDIFELAKSAPKKFGSDFNLKLFLEQLVFFKDLELTKISFIKKEHSLEEIKKFLEEQVKRIKEKEILGKKI